MFDSRNITLDFARIGAKGKSINAIVAFFNAQIQGSDVMIRNFKNRPFQTLWKVLLGITLPSILLYLANRDDGRWSEIPQWQKNLFWIVMPDHISKDEWAKMTPEQKAEKMSANPLKSGIYRIPKPFELGIIFGSVPERIMETIDTKDPTAFEELKNAIVSGFSPGFIPTGAIPIIENITNYSFFLDRPIVSQGKEGLPPPQQSGTYTSELAKKIGELLNYSPAKIDNLIYGYSGGLGRYTTSAIDKILKGTEIAKVPPEPEKELEQLPVIKAFMIADPIGSQSESVNRLYTLYSKTTAQATYANQLIKAGKEDETKTYVAKYPDTIHARLLRRVVADFSDINKEITSIRNSKDLDPKVKTQKIEQLQYLQTDIAKKVLKQIKETK